MAKNLKTENNNHQKTIPDWIILDCPPSLKFFIQFFRWTSVTFNGAIFIDNHNRQQELKNRYWIWFKHYLLVLYTLFAIVGLFMILFVELYQGYFQNTIHPISLSSSSQLMNSNETMMTNESFNIVTIDYSSSPMNRTIIDGETNDLSFQQIMKILYNWFHNDDDIIETEKLKTILRNIIKLLLVVHVTDSQILLNYSMISGLRIIRKLMSIPFVNEFDHSKRFAYRSLAIVYLFMAIIVSAGYIVFNKENFDKILDPQISAYTRTIKIIQMFGMVSGFSFKLITPLLFIYTMMLFRFCIQRLINTYAMVDNLDEVKMIQLRTQLSDLNDQFKEIIPCFSFPLTGLFATSIFIIISSSCFLMINNSSRGNYYIAFVFNIGLLAFMRLIVVASFGNLPSNCCRDLVRIVYENLQQWQLNEWMCFMELKRLQKEFIVNISSMYTVRQSSILAMLGFALNYIVILLQTENFSSTNSSSYSSIISSYSKQNDTNFNNDNDDDDTLLMNFNNNTQ
ncbi:uncharacterized protein LOC124491238 [Dermatophagoides farinae]|uniref:uncharacterized protein LOC124491238 n=1 Tax=Dermatophagoides farinae TaxID=6954 RepID=UPI003F638685